MLRSKFALGALALTVATVAPALDGQEHRVVGKEVSVGRAEATLGLDFANGERFDIALRDGSVVIDGNTVGNFRSGDALDAAFRALAGEAVALDDGALAAMLEDWSPPNTLSGEGLRIAVQIDRALEEALSARAERRQVVVDGPSITIEAGDERNLLRLLLSQAGRLEALQQALSDLADESFAIHIQEDVVVEAGESIEGSLVVVQGDVRVAGTVLGDVIVVDGRLDVDDGGTIEGSVRLIDARVGSDNGTVRGPVVNVSEEIENAPDIVVREEQLRDEVRRELRDEVRREIRRSERDRGGILMRPLRSTMRAVGGVLESLLLVFILGMIGVAVSTFAGQNLDVVAETARRSPGRAAAVGVAGSFLLVPVWILGALALVISIVGIPVAIAWLPLFPLAALAAAVLGVLAVARNLGEWLSDSDYRYTDWIRKTNPVYTIFGGLLALTSAFILANVLHLVPFAGVFRGMLTAAGFIILVMACQIGFGAVLLTRAGRRPEYYPMDPDEAWRRAVEVDIDLDASDVDDSGPDAPPRAAGEPDHA